jgi:hypothetical protein
MSALLAEAFRTCGTATPHVGTNNIIQQPEYTAQLPSSSTGQYLSRTISPSPIMSVQKVALITASSAGLGAQVARVLAPDFRVVSTSQLRSETRDAQ